MKANRSLPVWAIAVALAFAVVAVSLILALLDWSRNPALFGYAWLLSAWLEGVLYLLPVALVAGVPAGLRLARDAGLAGWTKTGVVAAVAGVIVYSIYVALKLGVGALLVPEGPITTLVFAVPIGLAIGCAAWPVSRLLVRA